MNFNPASVLHTKIKEEADNTSNVIDLDLDKSPEDLVYEWDSKVRLKFKSYSAVDSEQSLDVLMQWYIKTIKEEAVNFEDFQSLKSFTTNHMQFLKLYYVELNCCFVDNYLDNMEEILSFYINLEIKSLPIKQKSGNKRNYKRHLSTICCKIISLLNVYLSNRNDRMCHVVMKVKLNLQSEECKDLLNLLYGQFLTKRPKDLSDLEFCRAYILYQKWKTIRKSDDWEKMDELMYSLHERTPDSIKLNPVLKQILFPQNNSILDTLIHISENHVIISEQYFKYIKSHKIQEENVLVSGISDIEIQDDDIIPDLVGDAEDQEFELAYRNYVVSMSSVRQENDNVSDECVTIKEEIAGEDEDCQIVAVSFLGDEQESAEVIHEILDDDDGDIEIIYFKQKEDKQNVRQEDKEKSVTVSFLEPAGIPEPASVQEPTTVTEPRDVSMERVSSSTNNVSVPPPVTENNVMEASSSETNMEVADSPTSNSVEENPSSDTVVATPAAQTEPIPEPAESEPNKIVTNEKEDLIPLSCKEKTGLDVAPVEVAPKKKTCVSTETQTDEWPTDDTPASEKQVEQNGICRSYYYYGLDTPPSDQLPDEHIPPATESTTYPNVYANIVRSHTPDDSYNLTKATETDSLPCLADDKQLEPDRLNDCPSSNEYSPDLLDAAFIPDVEPNTKKKRKRLEEPPDIDVCSSQPGTWNSEENVECPEPVDDFQPNDDIGESCSLANDTAQEQAYSVQSPTPYNFVESDAGGASNIPCTSLDFVITSAESDNTAFAVQANHLDNANASPDVTSTSTDVHDYSGEVQVEEQVVYHIEDQAVAGDGYCFEEYVECSGSGTIEDNGNVTQSNIEDMEEEDMYIDIVGPVLMGQGQEVIYETPETSPVEEKMESPKRSANKELKICVEKISEVSCCGHGNSQEFDAEVQDFSKFEETVPAGLNMHDWNEMYCGPVSTGHKPGFANPDTSFPDLLAPESSAVCATSRSQLANTYPVVEVTSPAYEEIDDFRNYYEQTKHGKVQSVDKNIASTSHSVDNNIVTGTISPKSLESLQNTDRSPQYAIKRAPHGSRKRQRDSSRKVTISTEPLESMNSVPRDPSETLTPSRGILKQHFCDSSLAISERSLVDNRDPPPAKDNDKNKMIPLKELIVAVQPLSWEVIDNWLTMSERTRQLKRERAMLNRIFLKPIKVDYNKQKSPHIGKTDMVQYDKKDRTVTVPVPETFGQWRSNNVSQTKRSRLDEGLQELPYTEKKTGKRKAQSSSTMFNTPTRRGPGRPRKTL